MLEYNLDIEKRSTWVLTTQNAAALKMPFYLTEIGKFYAGGKLFYPAVGEGRVLFGVYPQRPGNLPHRGRRL